MFDEGMLFLMVCQGVDISLEPSYSASQKSLPHVATQISSSILANMHQTQISIEGLVVIAEKQAEFRRPAPMSRFSRDNRGRAREPIIQLQTNGHRSLPSFDIDPSLIAITASNPSAYIDGLFAGEDPLALSNGRHSNASSMLSIGDALSRPAPGPIGALTAAQPPVALEAGRVSTDTAVPTPVSLSPSASMKTNASTARPTTPESDDGKSFDFTPYCTYLSLCYRIHKTKISYYTSRQEKHQGDSRPGCSGSRGTTMVSTAIVQGRGY